MSYENPGFVNERPHSETVDNGIAAVQIPDNELAANTQKPSAEEKWKPRKWSQHLVAILASFSSLSIGYVNGWNANAVPFFKSARNESTHADKSYLGTIPWADGLEPLRGLSEDQTAWICSMVALGAMLGSLPAGVFANFSGRKITLIVNAFPCILCWLIVVYACDQLPWIYFSRVLAGVVTGISSAVVPLYIEEISQVSVRGALGVYHNLMVSVGILISYVSGATMPFFWNGLLPCIFPLGLLSLFSFMPESPIFSLAHGKVAAAEKAMRFLRGPWMSASREAGRLRAQAERVRCPGAAAGEPRCPLRALFRSNRSRAGVAISLMLMTSRQFSGINAVAFYTVEIFRGSDGSLAPIYCTIIVGAVKVLATLGACVFVDRFGRRPLLLQSGGFMAVSHFGLALYYHLLGSGYDTGALAGWVPLVLLCLFIVAYSLGFGPLPWFMMAELIPAEDKRWATGATSFVNWLGMFCVLQIFPLLSAYVGRQMTFVFFGTCCVVSTIGVAAVVPETKGKTLDEIQISIERRASSNVA